VDWPDRLEKKKGKSSCNEADWGGTFLSGKYEKRRDGIKKRGQRGSLETGRDSTNFCLLLQRSRGARDSERMPRAVKPHVRKDGETQADSTSHHRGSSGEKGKGLELAIGLGRSRREERGIWPSPLFPERERSDLGGGSQIDNNHTEKLEFPLKSRNLRKDTQEKRRSSKKENVDGGKTRAYSLSLSRMKLRRGTKGVCRLGARERERFKQTIAA